MNFFSLFNKRNYKLLYYKIKRYPKTVRKKNIDAKEFESVKNLIKYFNIKDFKAIVVVASGPTSKNISFKEDVLYITTNDAIKLVSSYNFIYILQDPYYLIKYLKSFKGRKFWNGTIFFIENNISNKKTFLSIKKYLRKKIRNKREFLISNIKDFEYDNNIFEEFNSVLVNNINFEYEAINSGFMCVQIAYVFSILSNKPLHIYGLDMGIGGDTYFNLESELGKSIKSDVNRKKVAKVLKAMYTSKAKIINKSNFMRNEL